MDLSIAESPGHQSSKRSQDNLLAYYRSANGAEVEAVLADLVLLDADPLVDITNTARISAVVANGRYYDHAALDALLAGVLAKTKSEP